MFMCKTVIIVAAVCAVSAAAPARAQDEGKVLENLNIFVGPDGSKQPQDLGINANMGIRFAGNAGFSIAPSLNLGMQVGVACNLSDAAVHVLDQIEGTSSRNQLYFTVGVFNRTGHRFNWGLAYDTLLEHYYDDFHLAQVRGQIGVDVTGDNEVGVWFTKSMKGENGVMGGTPVRLDPISQANAFYRHTWANHAQTAAWLGVAAGHDDVVWVLPANPRDRHVLVYGAELRMPLSERFAITGAANFLTPTATGTVDAFLGVAFYPGRSAMRQDRNAYAPIADVANNPTFSVNLHR
jgi:hypothetical protein